MLLLTISLICSFSLFVAILCYLLKLRGLHRSATKHNERLLHFLSLHKEMFEIIELSRDCVVHRNLENAILLKNKILEFDKSKEELLTIPDQSQCQV